MPWSSILVSIGVGSRGGWVYTGRVVMTAEDLDIIEEEEEEEGDEGVGGNVWWFSVESGDVGHPVVNEEAE